MSPFKNFWGHLTQDILPWLSCCFVATDLCGKLYQRRPSDDGSRYEPPRVGKYFKFFHFFPSIFFNDFYRARHEMSRI